MNLLDCDNYRDFLKVSFKQKRGLLSRLARYLPCDASYLSRVTKGQADLSLEQADRANRFFGHDQLESTCFVTLVNIERAGTSSLRSFFINQLEELRERRRDLHSRLGKNKKQIDHEVENAYYSNYLYAAIDCLLSTGLFADEIRLSERLNISQETARKVTNDLVNWNVIKRRKDGSFAGQHHTHLRKDSANIVRHHMNWRMHNLKSLASAPKDDFHYSSIFTAARSDKEKVQALCIDFVEELIAFIRPLKAEDGFCFTLDLFDL